MSLLKNNPFIRIFILYVLGILFAKLLPNPILIFITLSCIIGIYSFFQTRKRKYPFDLANSLFLSSLIVVLAIYFSQSKQQEIPSALDGYFVATLLENPIEKNKSYQLNVTINYAESLSSNKTKAILYSGKVDHIKELEAGDELLCKGHLRKICNNGNPFEFDYAEYMSSQGYYFSAYVSDESIKKTGKSRKSAALIAEKFRTKLLNKLRNQSISGESFQVISALTLGYRKELSKEVKSHFISTGAMHVLAVSGLHVGMIFLFLSTLLSFLKRKKKGHFLYVTIIGIILWAYAMITGFSPSVQRATVMLTFILIGSSSKRPTSIYNSLAASAFLLLLFNHNLLFEVGFQLSYMAVLSIVFFYPRLENLINSRYWIVKKAWQLSCISIAAQLGTFALGIFYFHQFPSYFLLSNFVVLPAAYLILGFTFIFLLLPGIEPVASIFSKLLNLTTESTIYLLKQIEQLPFSLVENISISMVQVFCLIGLFMLLMFFIKWKRKAYLFGIFTLLLLFQTSGLITNIGLFNQHKIIIYNEKDWLIHLIDGRNNYLISNTANSPSPYIFKNVLTELHLNEPQIIQLTDTTQINNSDLLISNRYINISNKFIQICSPTQVLYYPDEQAQAQLVLKKNKSFNASNPTKYIILNNGAFSIDY